MIILVLIMRQDASHVTDGAGIFFISSPRAVFTDTKGQTKSLHPY